MARSLEDKRYGKAKKTRLSRFLKLGHGIPRYDVYRRVMRRIAPEEIAGCFMNWIRAIKQEYEGEIAD
jgi:uncharacterized short protein YbdD (DUF466 family)